MALRDQPYFPLFVQDYLSDEKLSLCAYSTQGIYVRIMCVLHKSETYGGILFKQIPKQNFSSEEYFVYVLAKQTGVDMNDMKDVIEELLFCGVLKIEQNSGIDFLFQKRMVKDFSISESRSRAAKKGGGNPNLFKQTYKQIDKQIPEYENVIEDVIEDVIEIKEEKRVTGEKETKKRKPKKEIIELQYPFSSESFHSAWGILVEMPKWKKKIPHSLQLALNSLGKYKEEFALELINKAIENDWQGVTYPDTPDNYQKWLKNGNRKNQIGNSANGQSTYGSNAENKKRSVADLADMAERILQNT